MMLIHYYCGKVTKEPSVKALVLNMLEGDIDD
jgi:hypothetical protein